MSNLQSQFRKLSDELNRRLISRSEAIEVSLLAMLSGEHVLLLGVPGTAKSMHIDLICQAFAGDVTKFSHLLTKFTSDAEVLGPMDLGQFKKSGKHIRRIQGSFLSCHIGVLEECYKGSSSILNALLTAVNERVYMEEGVRKPIPLRTVFGASNETPEDKTLAALDDRLILRVEVSPLETDEEFRALASLVSSPMPKLLSLADWEKAAQEVSCLAISDDALEAWLKVKNLAAGEGISASARRWRKSLMVMQAAAWLDGRNTVTAGDVDVLRHILWKEPCDRGVVERVVCKVASPITATAVDILDAAKSVWDNRPMGAGQLDPVLLGQTHGTIKEMLGKLREEISSANGQNTKRAREAEMRLAGWVDQLGVQLLAAISAGPAAPGASS